MSRNRPPDSNRQARPGSAWKVDTPVLVVSVLTAVFATLFATLLLLRPDSTDPTESMPAGSRSTQSAPRVNTPLANAPPVSAPPRETIPRAEQQPEPMPNPAPRSQLQELGIQCAEGANCYPE